MAALLPVVTAQSGTDAESLISLERLSDRVLLVRTGVTYFDQVVAIASTKGIVVIDAGISPSLTAKYRKLIVREFGRDDFAYVINTHHHSDHTFGNQVFADTVIIGHDRCASGMRKEEEEIPNKIASRRSTTVEMNDDLRSLDPESEQGRQLQGSTYFLTESCDDMEAGLTLTPPSVSFNDRMTLDMGDLTLKLIYFGKGLHTESDIVVQLPDEEILFTGDLFSPAVKGCAVSADAAVSRWIEVLDGILHDQNEVRHVVTGHFGVLPRAHLEDVLDDCVRRLKDSDPK
jgi:glyoxylase-like metal-dependent hydrolase (beta-lactamase superfamily II)